MSIDQEYRLLERYLGRPVYTRVKFFGTLPANDTKSLGLCEIDRMVEFTVMARRHDGVFVKLPDNGNNPQNVTMWYNSASFFINTNADLSDYTEVYVTFKYTKT